MKRAALWLAFCFMAVEPTLAQYGAVGLSAVRARRHGNEGFSLFTSHSNDLFSWALVAGDFNGDGPDDLATGAPGHDNFEGEQNGSSVVFVHYSLPGVGLAGGSAGQVVTQAGNPDPPEPFDGLGAALASCDFNGDGHADLAIGAPYEDESPLVDTGAEWVLYGSCFSDGFDVSNTVRWSASVP